MKAIGVRRECRDGSAKLPSAHVSKRSWLVGFLQESSLLVSDNAIDLRNRQGESVDSIVDLAVYGVSPWSEKAKSKPTGCLAGSAAINGMSVSFTLISCSRKDASLLG